MNQEELVKALPEEGGASLQELERTKLEVSSPLLEDGSQPLVPVEPDTRTDNEVMTDYLNDPIVVNNLNQWKKGLWDAFKHRQFTIKKVADKMRIPRKELVQYMGILVMKGMVHMRREGEKEYFKVCPTLADKIAYLEEDKVAAQKLVDKIDAEIARLQVSGKSE